MSTVIKVENLGKLYRLGDVGTGTISHDLNRWWARLRGKEDPFLKLGIENDRTKKATSEFVWAINNINFDVEQGDVVGIIGKNGAGKSTLLKILSRTTTPSTGSFKVKGRIASLLEVGTGFHPELTGKENIFLNGAIMGMKKAEIRRKFDEIVYFSGVEKYIDTPVKRYSSGMYVRLAFAVAAHLEPEILIVDEVLAVGDAEFQEKCLGKMKDVSRQGRTVLFVSHNIGAVKQLCTKGMLLQNGQLKMTGTTSDVTNKYFAIDDEALSKGSIPRDHKRYNTGEAFLDTVHTIDRNNQYTDKYFFREPIRIKIRAYFNQDVKDPVFSVGILNDEMQKISYCEYPENDQTTLSFKKGEYEIVFSFEDSFLPGKYYLAPTIMHQNGFTIDHVERISEFEVSSFSRDGIHNYKWNVKHGNSYLKINNIDINKL